MQRLANKGLPLGNALWRSASGQRHEGCSGRHVRPRNRVTSVCLAAKPRQTPSGSPDCTVGDVDAAMPGSEPAAPLPVCSQTCCNGWQMASVPNTSDPAIRAACSTEPRDCFCAVANPKCTTAAAGVWRQGGAMPPAGKITKFRCTSG